METKTAEQLKKDCELLVKEFPQFAGKNAYPFEYTKTGAAAENQIDAISGATVTTEAVTGGVNAGLYYFKTVLASGSISE